LISLVLLVTLPSALAENGYLLTARFGLWIGRRIFDHGRILRSCCGAAKKPNRAVDLV